MAAESPVHLATGRQSLHPAQQLTASAGTYHIDRPIKHNNRSIVKLMSSAGPLRPEPKAQGEPAKLPRNLVVGSHCGPLGTGTEVGPLCAPLRIKVKVPPGGETAPDSPQGDGQARSGCQPQGFAGISQGIARPR